MPEWLLQSENYAPRADKDTFLSKSILALLGLISKIRAQDTAAAPTRYAVNPFFKLVFTLTLAVLVSLTREFAFLFAALTYVLLYLCVQPIRTLRRVLATGAAVTAFTFVILLPTALGGNGYSLTMMPVKVFTAVTAVNLLSHTSRWSELLSALKRFRAPDMLVFVLDITIRYIVMLGETTLESLYALKLRSVGRNTRKYNALSGVAGSLFLRSRQMAEDTHSAMLCRGFTGEYRVYQKFSFTLGDAGYILVNAGLILLYIYITRDANAGIG
ncbi:MAG: energy-coupling factor transporter transmembrane protein EcfT [Oscillospiraceae bacterium]|nr:energy-coupling factor transporter transmembrane protein EcfT [Oscillospiraceae bacterium]